MWLAVLWKKLQRLLKRKNHRDTNKSFSNFKHQQRVNTFQGNLERLFYFINVKALVQKDKQDKKEKEKGET